MKTLGVLIVGFCIGVTAVLLLLYPKYYDAQARAAELQRAVEQARQKEEQARSTEERERAARKAGDMAKLREMEEARAKAVAEQMRQLEAARVADRQSREARCKTECPPR